MREQQHLYQLGMGYFLDSDNYYKGVIQALHAGAASYLLLNPGGGPVGIGATVPRSVFSIVSPNVTGPTAPQITVCEGSNLPRRDTSWA